MDVETLTSATEFRLTANEWLADIDAEAPTGPPSLWFKRLPLKRRSAVQCPVFGNLVYELTAGQVGTGFAWKLYICCAAATPVSGTRVASGLHPGTPKGVKV